jgi:DNA-binding GntR family transcriptional regulator
MNPVIEPEKERRLVFQGYQTLRTKIVRGEYLPGTRLKLDTLQQSLGLSSSPLREALNRLVVEGLVEAHEGRGFRAATISIAELHELTHLRLLLDCDALRRSITLGDEEWEGRVVAAAHKLRSGNAAVDAEDWSERHRNFHLALLSGCGLPRLMRLCETLFDQAERYRRIARLSSHHRKKNVEHRKLEDAALKRNANAAVKILSEHIRKTADRVVDVLREAEVAPPEKRRDGK